MSNATSLKQRIHNGETLLGVSVPINTTRRRLEDILAQDDYAFVWTDSQHSAFNEERLVEFCAMTVDLNIHAHLRIKHTRHAYLIGNLLDLGPCGVEVPQVEDVATVREAIDAFYYPQVGKRSWGGAARRGVNERPDRLEYAAWWNEYGVLWMQIESINAVTTAAQLALPGVDCLSWGPADLAFNMEGHPGHPFQTDDDCIKHALMQLENSNATLCYRNYVHNKRNRYLDMGIKMILEPPKS